MCLIGGIFLIVNGVSAQQKKLEKELQSAKNKVQGDKILPALDLGKIPSVAISLRDPRVRLSIMQQDADAKKGNLLIPKRYVLCKNLRCANLLAVRADRCPYCGQEQDPYRDTSPEDDTDGDGIPDLVEQKHDFLNYLDPYDAYFDEDGDGFLNIEEHLAGTAMDDPDDFPALALLLRVTQVGKRRLPFQFSRVRTLDSELRSDWRVEFVVGRAPRISAKIGETIAYGYKLLAVNEARDEVTVESPEGMRYNMPANRMVEEDVATAQMMYLAGRTRTSRRVRVLRRVGEEFYLEKIKDGDPYREFYRIISGTTRNNLVVGLLNEQGGAVQQEFNVNMLDPKKDFIPEIEGATGRRGQEEMFEEDPRQGGARRRPRRAY